jgi:hypothetical protein
MVCAFTAIKAPMANKVASSQSLHSCVKESQPLVQRWPVGLDQDVVFAKITKNHHEAPP